MYQEKKDASLDNEKSSQGEIVLRLTIAREAAARSKDLVERLFVMLSAVRCTNNPFVDAKDARPKADTFMGEEIAQITDIIWDTNNILDELISSLRL